MTEGFGRWVAHLWRREVDAHHWLPLSHPQRMAAMIGEFVDHLAGAPAWTDLQAARVNPEAAEIS